MFLLEVIVLTEDRRHDDGLVPVTLLFFGLGGTLLHLTTLLSQHVGIEDGSKMGLVFLLVVSKPKALPLRLVDFHRLLLLVAYGGHEEYLAVLGLEGIYLVDHVERLLGRFTAEEVDLLLGMGGHHGIVFLCKLGAEVIDMSFVMVVLHHVEVHADILL